jgi:hypothetical protein
MIHYTESEVESHSQCMMNALSEHRSAAVLSKIYDDFIGKQFYQKIISRKGNQ